MREGRLRYDADLGTFCFEDEGSIESLLPGDILSVQEHPLATRYTRFRVEGEENGDWMLVRLRSPRRHPHRVKLERGCLFAARMVSSHKEEAGRECDFSRRTETQECDI